MSNAAAAPAAIDHTAISEQHLVTASGPWPLQARVQVQGQGPGLVLMLHGWPDTLALWDGTVAALAKGWRCARLTLPGFGPEGQQPGFKPPTLHAMTAFLRQVIDQLSPDQPVTLLLHDWGCVFGYELALRHPQRVARLIGVDVGDHNSAALKRQLKPSQGLAVAGYQLWLAVAWKFGQQKGGGRGQRMTRAMARWLRCPSAPQDMHSGMNYPYAMRWFGTAGGLGCARQIDLPMPLLYLYGLRKPFMFHSADWLAQLAARPGSAQMALPTGHWVMSEQPELFNSVVQHWLATGRLPPGGGQ